MSNASEAIERAKEEVAQENLEKGVESLKVLLRQRASAKTVLDNIDREIEDTEEAIKQGNL